MQMTVRFVYKVIPVVIVNMIDLPKLTTLVSTKWSFAYPRRIVFVSWYLYLSVILDVDKLRDVSLPNSFECVMIAQIESRIEEMIIEL